MRFFLGTWLALNLCVFNIDEIKTVPGVPVSHPFVERLIGTVRREFLDGKTPAELSGESSRERATLDEFRWETHCRGLVQLPMAA